MLVVVAAVAIRLAVGVVVGLVSAVMWIVVAVALIAAVLWARSTLKSAKREKREKPEKTVRGTTSRQVAAPVEDPIEAEMRRITEQLREQGRR